MLKHDKRFRCTVLDCKKQAVFGTQNDLDRHLKSVHKLETGRATTSFRCSVPNCPKKNKTWPRLDNFKCHIIRLHKKEVGSKENFDQDRMKEIIQRYAHHQI